MAVWSALAAALLALALQGRPPLESGAVRRLDLSTEEGTSILYFRLDAPGPRRDPPLGLVRWVRGPGGEAGALRLETETTFPSIGTRVIQDEVLAEGERKLIWREVRPRAGRTLLVRSGDHGELHVTQTIGGDVLRRSLGGAGSALFPLQLADRLRRAPEGARTVTLFEPLGGALAPARTFVRRLPGPGCLRVAGIVREDGTSGGLWLFAASEPVAFRLQAGGPLATPISAEEHARLIASSSSAGEGEKADGKDG